MHALQWQKKKCKSRQLGVAGTRARIAVLVVTSLALFPYLGLSAQGTDRPIYFNFSSNGFSATGKWVPRDPTNKPAFPSETEIDCTQDDRGCVEATAEYYYGHPHVSVHYFQILKWDKDNIIATSSDGACMTSTLLISFAEKSISETDSMKQLDEKTKEACNFLGVKKTETSLFVLKNSERWNREH